MPVGGATALVQLSDYLDPVRLLERMMDEYDLLGSHRNR